MNNYTYSDKYRERVIKQLASKSILIVKEKHGTVYLDASSLEALSKSALSLLKSRRKAGYFYEEPTLPSKPSLDDLQRASLPNGPVKIAADRENDEYKRELVSYTDALDFINAVDEAIQKKDGLAAYLLLTVREDYEYEGIRLESVESSYE